MILVTGGTGLVGGHLIWHLLQKHNKVVAIKRESSKISQLESILGFYTDDVNSYIKRVEWRIADMCDEDSLRKSLSGIDTVYHCAAMVSLGGSGSGMTDVNVSGTKMMVELALEQKIRRFCFVSSIAACGHNQNPNDLIDENTPVYPDEIQSLYAKSKYLSEQEVWKGIKNGLHAVIVNPGVILGYSGSDSGSARIFSLVKKGLLFYTPGGSGYVDVKDVAAMMIALSESEIAGERFILVGENKTTREILSAIAAGYGKVKPFIGINRGMMMFLGRIAETLAKVTGVKPLFDQQAAKSATSLSRYSNAKVLNALHIKFTPIDSCISGVCKFDEKSGY